MDNIIEKLKKTRQKIGWTQTQLANRAGVSLPTIQNIEGGRANPAVETLGSICQAMHLKLAIGESKRNIPLAVFIALRLRGMTEDDLTECQDYIALALEDGISLEEEILIPLIRAEVRRSGFKGPEADRLRSLLRVLES